ncbi:TRAP transporter substrate-binding protein DctP [Nocardioides sp.]|uniref:TRAP transporter substrate-binding protein DctP n=1 Tax=Nocardioides sp. TaxID=35761 RepID=UPI0032197BBA
MHLNSRKLAAAAVSAMALPLALAGCSGDSAGSDGGSATLTFSTFLTEDHPASVAAQAWMSQVTDATDGSVEFETFYNASLCEAPESIACAENGTADVVLAVPAYTPEMLLANIGSTTFVTKDLQANSDAINALYADEPDFQAEYSDRNQRMLFQFNNSMPVLVTKDPVTSFDALSGKDIRASGSMVNGISALGVNPVAIDPAEIYESLERGVVAGAAFPVESVVDYRLTEVAPNAYDLGEWMGSYAMNSYTMNQGAYDGLSADQQEAIDSVSSEIAGSYVDEFLIPAVEENCRALAAEGIELQSLGPVDDGEAWVAAAGGTQQSTWVEGASSATDDAEAFYNSYVDRVADLESGDAPTTAEICASA